MFLTLTYFNFYGIACVAVTPNLLVAAVLSGAFYGKPRPDHIVAAWNPASSVALAVYCADTSTLLMPFIWLVPIDSCAADRRLAAAHLQLVRLFGLKVPPPAERQDILHLVAAGIFNLFAGFVISRASLPGWWVWMVGAATVQCCIDARQWCWPCFSYTAAYILLCPAGCSVHAWPLGMPTLAGVLCAPVPKLSTHGCPCSCFFCMILTHLQLVALTPLHLLSCSTT